MFYKTTILKKEEFLPYHQHLLMKVWIENPPKEEKILNEWFINLVHVVGMEQVMECFKPWGVLKSEWVMIDRNEFPIITETGTWENQTT